MASPEAILHLAVLHALSQAGFASTSRAASLSLSSVLGRYLQVVATECVQRAHMAGRGKPGAMDVAVVLREMGSGVEEVMDWTAERESRSMLTGEMEDLTSYLREGLSTDHEEELFHMSYVPIDEIPPDQDSTDDEEGENSTSSPIQNGKQVHSESDGPPSSPNGHLSSTLTGSSSTLVKEEPSSTSSYPLIILRPYSPDLLWLPPLPNESDPASSHAPLAALPLSIQSSKLSLEEKFRTRSTFSSSSLSSTFSDPLTSNPISDLDVFAPTPSSLKSLLSTYAATASDLSVTLQQNELRWQLSEHLRRSPFPPLTPIPTLSLASSSLPGPRITPIVPSHTPTLPSRLVPLHRLAPTLLSHLLESMRSPNLPPGLRERLTSLRTPLAFKRENGQLMLYGESIHGPDAVALSRARGKTEGEEKREEYKSTWDQGPRGSKRWASGELPTGRKVIKFSEGETPRMAVNVSNTDSTQDAVEFVSGLGTKEKAKIRIKLGEGDRSASPREGSLTPGDFTRKVSSPSIGWPGVHGGGAVSPINLDGTGGGVHL
ncbi:hypothetical protein TREMEDRAFT_63123 [Tremella mesenterica DSM 1558]|uniref:uncharacterized protein n=1 Tax=Tremella mesenterica (strain ATCC 24925 / CBS 8224 / DSM 1558 / NBRC 9311 / NRRL Y-6157 / RJB 2259-6 / UBC 559-6) TaxID=578456 RepID=UPI0003F4A1B8|nr:uncharacterized protein TREMEDRAFT_63123 [Tremella mesenterica DSM 1558]EIW68658.1 hypothetical protein TREMEDRAFT_63123 [Tremella mesenterica DSM 1558]